MGKRSARSEQRHNQGRTFLIRRHLSPSNSKGVVVFWVWSSSLIGKPFSAGCTAVNASWGDRTPSSIGIVGSRPSWIAWIKSWVSARCKSYSVEIIDTNLIRHALHPFKKQNIYWNLNFHNRNLRMDCNHTLLRLYEHPYNLIRALLKTPLDCQLICFGYHQLHWLIFSFELTLVFQLYFIWANALYFPFNGPCDILMPLLNQPGSTISHVSGFVLRAYKMGEGQAGKRRRFKTQRS